MQVERLLGDLTASLPIPAVMTPELRTLLRDKVGENDQPIVCRVTRVDYAGDEGGIMCKLELDRAIAGDGAFFVSITHLRFQGWSSLTRAIVAYQKRRVKGIRRLGIDVAWPR